MGKPVRWTAGLGLAVVVVAVLFVPRLISTDRTATPDTVADAPESRLRVIVQRVVPQPLTERLATTGTVRANEEVRLVSQVAGVVERINFDEGAPVQSGQLLVKLDDTELRAERERVVYRLELAERREARQRELREQGITSEQEYDLAQSEVSVLRAEMRVVEAKLEKMEIRAPFSGVIGLRFVSLGSYLSPQTRIATLQDLARVKLDFTVPEKYVGQVAVGDGVDFRVKGSESGYRGEIYAIEPRVDAETRSLLVRAVSDNPGRRLFPGAFADVDLVVRDIPDALVVPSMAVLPELGGRKVFVLEDGAAQPRRVETGIRTRDLVQITHGLEPNEMVIVSAIQRLRAGLPVEAKQAEAPQP